MTISKISWYSVLVDFFGILSVLLRVVMKKLYAKINNKLTSRQKSPNNPRKSGFYDVQEAEKEYEISRSIPNGVFMNDSFSEDDSKFEDARTSMVDSVTEEGEDDDDRVYVDIDLKKKDDEPFEMETSEYDVPRISFKFFEKHVRHKQQDQDNTYENVAGETGEHPRHSTPIPVISVTSADESAVSKDKPSTPVPRLRSEVKIIMTAVDIDIGEGDTAECHVEELKGVEKLEQSKSRSVSQEFVSTTSIEFSKSLVKPQFSLKKCESFPSVLRNIRDDEDDEENFYKVPRCLKRNRLSQSLKDFEAEDNDLATRISSASSVDCLSISRTCPIPNRTECSSEPSKGYASEETIHRKRKNLKSFLRKPRDRLQVLKTRFNNMMNDQAALQRVGAFEDKPKLTINFDGVLKNSRMKCKDMIKSTGKFFHKRRSSTNSSTMNSVEDLTKISCTPVRTELKASDIEYKLNTSDHSENRCSDKENDEPNTSTEGAADHGLIRSKFGKICSPVSVKGQNGFEDLRRYVKNGSDFCKELATILQDRAEAETAYAKSLSKLSVKLTRVCRDGVGTLNEGWKAVAQELEARAESHRVLSSALLEESAKPLKSMSEGQQKCRKQAESAVDRAAKSLGDLRQSEGKYKKNSHICARENEKLQDAALIDNTRLSRSTSLIHLGNIQKIPSERDNAKLELKRRKAEENTKKADIEYYETCVKAERTRLEWESAVLRGVDTFQSLEEERLNCLKNALESYIHHSTELTPRLTEVTERLRLPVAQSEPTKDLTTFLNLRQTSQQVSEQLLPDFYCEHITLAMNRERRKKALVELLNIIRKDIECERKQKNGVENMSKAIKQNPTFGAKDSQNTFSEKLYHFKSMLIYFEATRYKVQNALAELDSNPRTGHPLASHITITRDKSGLQQSVLKVPQWLREELIDCNRSPVSEKSLNSAKSDLQIHEIEDRADWSDRGAADGNSNQHDSDFDEFSSQCSSSGDAKYASEDGIVQPVAQCKALYHYTPNFTDELELNPGDMLSVYRKQEDGWWLGECNGNVGIFPATYVEVVPT
ncbi:uncharacterized protein LOC123311459 isoform X3 [Coccinella septempunctata]|uniref:uncharacterized protein LOC123311459 isoform X3 n=1 Tax=Coccinella septempunctata TaxID=41139 RepID=UPI001D089BC4|nr:uncharacterized protein LOC123311459 isoform X3 [Coccinella septempunctata]